MIRRGLADDAEWIRDTATLVYAPLGDYRSIIPSWMAHPGVLTFLDVDDADRERRGFILVGFYEPQGGPNGYVADLIAIAVAPEHQRSGAGQRLLAYALDLAGLAARRVAVPEMRLTVADTNRPALGLFTKFGFEVLDDQHGVYDGGQRAIRMRRRIA
jgi:ribosomal protein S18 acetylase RimI-like enzyme